MIKRNKILDFNHRKSIYELIMKNPGLHLRKLERLTDFSFGNLRYHLNYMQDKGLIIAIKDNGFSRYFISKEVRDEDKNLISIFRQKTLRKMLIVILMFEAKKVFFRDDFVNLPNLKDWYDPKRFQLFKHRTTIEFHLKKLVKAGILKTIKEKQKKGYIIKESEKIWDFLLRYNHILDYLETNQLVNYTNDYLISYITEPTFNKIWDVFPHPYHI